tara:strand:- start:2743 stop:2973 length:231 start_codon:yes stop_codon:yes gene_type:complete
MRLRVDGRFKVVTFETALPLLKVVTVTFATGTLFLGVAFVVAFALRVLVFLVPVLELVGVDLETVEAVGIDSLKSN